MYSFWRRFTYLQCIYLFAYLFIYHLLLLHLLIPPTYLSMWELTFQKEEMATHLFIYQGVDIPLHVFFQFIYLSMNLPPNVSMRWMAAYHLFIYLRKGWPPI